MSRRSIAAWMMTFSLVTPIGVMMGTALTTVADNAVSCALTSIAAGTFVYVGLFEVAQREVCAAGEALYPGMVSLALGFALMSMLAIWV